jgi:quercetin dioxygenase-like cupin family protein
MSTFKTTKFLDNIQYNDNAPAIDMLLESDFTKEIRIVFKAGQTMQKHQTPFPIVVELVKGTLDFTVYDGTKDPEKLNLEAGDIISVQAGIPHDLSATSDCIARLTLSKGDTKERVDEVIA